MNSLPDKMLDLDLDLDTAPERPGVPHAFLSCTDLAVFKAFFNRTGDDRTPPAGQWDRQAAAKTSEASAEAT